MTWCFYYQVEGGEEYWHEALSSEREAIVASKKPRYTTILDVSEFVTDDMTPEQIASLKHRGPMYIDFDSTDIGVSISAFKRLLGKLEEAEVDLRACELFASGGRGFHVIIPQLMFMPKVPPKGIQQLPLIYKEIAYSFFVDTMDLRIYSGRKGRMFRTVNVERENGKYKVPLTVEEAKGITPELYAEYIQAPRRAPAIVPPKPVSKLMVEFTKAEQRVGNALKKRKDSSKDAELLAKWNGEFPPTLLKLMNGVGLDSEVGFHPIAMQIAITCNALGKSEDEMLALCEGLCEKHVSDGYRYNTPQKRRDELVRMHRYTAGNPCYTYSKGAVKALLANTAAAADLDGLTEAAGTQVDAKVPDNTLLCGTIMTDSGIYRQTDNGLTAISDIGFTDVEMLFDVESEKAQGFNVNVNLNGRFMGRRTLKPEHFQSRQKFHMFCLEQGGVMQGGDQQVAAVATILREMAMKENKVLYALHREGLDMIVRPGTKDGTLDRVWASAEGVESFGTTPVKYVFRPHYMVEGALKSDLMDAPDLSFDNETAAVIEALFEMNTPYAIAALLGWTVSTFQRALYRMFWNQFPLCHIFGQAGAGKTETVYSFQRFFYVNRRPEMIQCDSSPYAIERTVQSSSSIPVVLDEYKPREFRRDKRDRLLTMFRAAYNEGKVRRGGGTGEIGSSWKEMQEETYTAPIIFIGEALEDQSAVQERSVIVPLSKAGIIGREAQHRVVKDGGLALAAIGKKLAEVTIRGLKAEEFKAAHERNVDAVRDVAFRRTNHRVCYNMAVVLTGLDYLKTVLDLGFKGRFDHQFARSREAILDLDNQVAVTVMPEAAKVLSTLAFISHTEEVTGELGLRLGVDYTYPNDDALEIKVRNCYVKYVAWCLRKGQTPLYDSEEACVHGLANYAAIVDKTCASSALKDSANTRVFRFSVKHLEEEGVEPFRIK